MGARSEGWGALAPSWNLKKMTSYAAFLRNALTFSLSLSALAINTLKVSLKRRKKAQNFRLRNFYRCWGFCPLWKIFCVAHDGSRFYNQ